MNKVAGVGGVNLYVRLFSSNVLIDDDTTLSSLAEPVWQGYAPYNSALWSAPTVDTNGDIVIVSPVIVFQGPVALPGATVYGWFVTMGDGAGRLLWMAERLPTPVPMQYPADQIPVRIEARLRYLAA